MEEKSYYENLSDEHLNFIYGKDHMTEKDFHYVHILYEAKERGIILILNHTSSWSALQKKLVKMGMAHKKHDDSLIISMKTSRGEMVEFKAEDFGRQYSLKTLEKRFHSPYKPR